MPETRLLVVLGVRRFRADPRASTVVTAHRSRLFLLPRLFFFFAILGPDQGGYIFYAGASLAGVSCRRRWPRLLLLS